MLGVVVPIYNKGRYLRECVDSLKHQLDGNIEIVLVDDGSLDDSAEIAQKYADENANIQVVRQKNKGPIVARLEGVKRLDTKYVTFVDADDWVSEDTYKSLAHYMERGIDVIEYDIYRYHGEQNVVRCRRKLAYGEYDTASIRDEILPNMIWDFSMGEGLIDPSVCNKLVKRELLYRTYEEARSLHIHYGEDVAITYPVMTRCRSFAYSKSGGYYHRRFSQDKYPYMQNEHFFRDLSILHEHLLATIADDHPFIVRQLDGFYLYSVKYYMRRYGMDSVDVDYMFPFHMVPVNSRIVLYGAGQVGWHYYKQLMKTPYCDLVSWVDKNSNLEMVDKPGKIRDISYDYVVVAIKNKRVVDEVINALTGMGVPSDKIIWSDCFE